MGATAGAGSGRLTKGTLSRVTFFSQTGMTEPLGRSQVLAYVRGLARAGWGMEVVSTEPSSASDDQLHALKEELSREGIGYHFARRGGRGGPGGKLAEFGEAIRLLWTHTRKVRPQIIHARSQLPATLAYPVARALGARLIFDCRGFVAEEYAEAGHWQEGSSRFRGFKAVERQLFRRADGLVVLTNAARQWLQRDTDFVEPGTPFVYVPCCVDLDRFRADDSARRATRLRWKADDSFVLLYSGSLSRWYCEREIVQLFAAVRRHRRAKLVVLTKSPADQLHREALSLGVPVSDLIVEAVRPAEMPAALSGADGAVSFRRRSHASLACSPTKLAEYLAVGLPVVMNRGIGDGDELFDAEGSVIDAGEMTPEELDRAANRLVALDPTQVARRARAVAEERFALSAGVSRYDALYRAVSGPS